MNEQSKRQRANIIGAMWMVFAMAIFALEDTFLKLAMNTIPVGQVLMIFGLGGAVIFAVIAKARHEPLFVADVLSRPMKIRICFEVTGRLFFVLALMLNPLSLVTAILQATPLVVVAGAALFMGEAVGWRRWASILLGMVGVLIVLRPSADGVSLYAITAVIGMLGFAGRDLASRAAPKTISHTMLGFYGFGAVVIAGIVFSLWEQRAYIWPDAFTVACLVAGIVGGCIAYTALMRAMRTGDVSAVTPFRYSRLIFGILCGVLIFGESLDAGMLIGCALIVLSGLFVLQRSAQV